MSNTRMKDLTVVMPCWQSPELLAVSIPSLIDNMTVDCDIFVCLNEPDYTSVNILNAHKEIKTIHINNNDGPSAVDHAIPFLNSKYIVNINSDMLFSKGWEIALMELIEEHPHATASSTLVEPVDGGHEHWLFDNLGDFLDPNVRVLFENNVASGKYSIEKRYLNNHPIMCTTEDYLKVGGYSDNMDQDWITLKGRGLDDYFIWRLMQLHDDYKFIASDKSFVYHGVSLNANKVERDVSRCPNACFTARTGIAIAELYERMDYGQRL